MVNTGTTAKQSQELELELLMLELEELLTLSQKSDIDLGFELDWLKQE